MFQKESQFQVLIHSQYAFDVCREHVNNFEDCRQTDTPVPRDPIHCKAQAKEVLGCYKDACILENTLFKMYFQYIDNIQVFKCYMVLIEYFKRQTQRV